jgi:hypothetical protein
MSILQLDPPLPMTCPKGNGVCHFLIDYGIEENLYWVIMIDDSGEIWVFDNTKVRMQKNITIGRTLEEKNLKPKPPFVR